MFQYEIMPNQLLCMKLNHLSNTNAIGYLCCYGGDNLNFYVGNYQIYVSLSNINTKRSL